MSLSAPTSDAPEVAIAENLASGNVVALGDLTAPQIQKWLDYLDLSPQSIVNYRRVLSNLFNHAATANAYALEAADRVVVPVEPTTGDRNATRPFPAGIRENDV